MTAPLVTVLTKAPRPGTVKTRLAPAVGPLGAARLHRRFVDATLEKLSASGLPGRVAVGADPNGTYAAELAARGWPVVGQASGGLGARMRAVLAGSGRRVVIGTDCVVFDPEWLVAAATSQAPVAIAPSEDGGYWALSVAPGLPPEVLDDLFVGVPWSTRDVLSITLGRCAARGIEVDLLPRCYDVDEPPELTRLLHDPRCPLPVRALLETLPCPS